MQRASKKFRIFVLLVCVAVGLTCVFQKAVWEPGTKVWERLETDTTCPIPKIDPFLKSTKFLIELADELGGTPKCIGKEIKFRADINSSLIRAGTADFWKPLTCCYTVFSRGSATNILNGDQCFPITEAVTRIPLNHKNLDIKCIEQSTQNPVYRYQIQAGHLRSELELKNLTETPAGSEKQVSLLILGLDSVSHVNFLRYMKRTQEFLISNLSAIEFHGLNKVGRGTDDNLIALLTGCKLWHPKKVDPGCELIWTEFSNQGYVTFHSEDHPHNANHVYPVVRKPRKGIGTDFDNSEYMSGVHSLNNITLKDNLLDKYGCYGDQFVYDVLLKDALSVAQSLANRPYFNFVWSTTVAHQVLRNTEYMDDPTFQLLTQLWKDGLLNNTVVILYSDHGLSFGEYSKTGTGIVEGLMPLLYVVFPEWFSRKYATEVENMRMNAKRLTTPYDIYRTLKQLLDLSQLSNPDFSEQKGHFGQSLFWPIPASRTCEVAGIPPEYCICLVRTPLDNPQIDLNVVRGAEYAVGWLNSVLREFPMCEAVRLSEILSASTLMSRIQSDGGISYQILFKTLPNAAEFQAIFTFEPEINLVGEVNRVNAYGKQSACIEAWDNASYVKSACYCKSTQVK